MGMHRVRDRAAELHAYIFPLLKMVCGRSIIDVFLCWGSIWFRGQSEWIFMLCRGQMLWNAGDSGGMDAVWFRPAAQAAGCTGLAADDRRSTNDHVNHVNRVNRVNRVDRADRADHVNRANCADRADRVNHVNRADRPPVNEPSADHPAPHFCNERSRLPCAAGFLCCFCSASR